MNFKKNVFLFFLTIVLAANPLKLQAQDPVSPIPFIPPQNAQELYNLLNKTTISGFVKFNGEIINNYKEYHAPDGRILGYNEDIQNTDSCWRVVSKDTVCYYYETYKNKESCWHISFISPTELSGYSINPERRHIAMKGWLSEGNPDQLSFPDKNWTCGLQVVAQQ